MKKFNWRGLLKEHSLFTSLDEKEVERIIDQLVDDKVSQEREYTEGQVIVREGELSDSAFLLGSGSVEVILQGPYGLETTVSNLRQGEFFGEMALIEKKPRAATVKAKERSILLEIKGQEFLKLLDEHRDVESKMLLKLSERLRYANEQVVSVKLKGIDEKLEGFNVRLDAELKAVDASLKAALAVFDQTKIRTNEIIDSAERRQKNTTFWMGIIGGAFTIVFGFLAFLGLKEFIDLRAVGNQAEKAKQAIEQVNEASASLERLLPQIEKLQEAKSAIAFYVWSEIQHPRFIEVLRTGTPEKILNSYSELKTYQINVSWFLDDVELAMRDRPKRDYTQILETISNDADNPKDRIRGQYLLLLNKILTDKKEKFDQELKKFETYAQNRGPYEYDLSAVASLFENDRSTEEQKKKFRQVKQLIPMAGNH